MIFSIKRNIDVYLIKFIPLAFTLVKYKKICEKCSCGQAHFPFSRNIAIERWKRALS